MNNKISSALILDGHNAPICTSRRSRHKVGTALRTSEERFNGGKGHDTTGAVAREDAEALAEVKEEIKGDTGGRGAVTTPLLCLAATTPLAPHAKGREDLRSGCE